MMIIIEKTAAKETAEPEIAPTVIGWLFTTPMTKSAWTVLVTVSTRYD